MNLILNLISSNFSTQIQVDKPLFEVYFLISKDIHLELIKQVQTLNISHTLNANGGMFEFNQEQIEKDLDDHIEYFSYEFVQNDNVFWCAQ